MKSGQQIAHYRIIDVLGTGAQGTVYLAEDLHLGRKVALKVLLTPAMKGSQAFLRFRREAEAASRLDHPGICTVYDADHSGDRAYIAMQYLQGEPLSDVIARIKEQARPPASDSGSGHTTAGREEILARIRVIERVADALHAAHEAGLVHRDVKAGNIILTTDGQPVLCDFGLVHDEDPASQQLTRTGDVFGTPLYMSPEQIRGERTDRRSDVFSLGIVAYEYLTGHRPFEGATYAELFRAISERAPPNPARFGAHLPRDLRIVLETALEKDRKRRYASAAAFGEDLHRVRSFEPIRARPIGPWLRIRRWVQRRPAAAVAVGLAFLLLVGGPLAYGLQQRAARASIQAEKEESDRQRQRAEWLAYRAGVQAAAGSLESGLIGNAKLRLAECPAQHRGWEWHVLSQMADSSDVLFTLAPPEPTRSVTPAASLKMLPFLAPTADLASSGDWIAFPSIDHNVHLWNKASQQDVALPGHTHVVTDLAFTRDGMLLASASWDCTARLWNVTTGKPHLILRGHETGLTGADFTPDGSKLVTSDCVGEIRVWDTATGNCLRVQERHEHGARAFMLTPGGETILVIRGKFVEEIELASGRVLRELTRHRTGIFQGALDPSGERLAVTDSKVALRLVDVSTGKQTRRIRANLAGITGLRFIEGGRLIAATFEDGTVRGWDAATGHAVFSRTGHDRYPVALLWTDTWGLVTWGLDGTLRRWSTAPDFARVSLAVDGAPQGAEFGPSGRKLAVGGWKGIVKVFEVATGEQLAAYRGHKNRITDIAFSPDGTTVASVSRDGTARVWHGKEGKILGEPAKRLSAIAFSPDGRLLAFGGESHCIRTWDLQADSPRAVIEVDASVLDLKFAPQGRMLAAALTDGTIRIWDCDESRFTAELLGHAGAVLGVLFHPERPELVSCGEDATVRIWDLETGRCRRVLRGHGQRIYAIALSAPEHRIVSASPDGTVRIWDLDTGQVLVTLTGFGFVTKLAMRPDGRAFAVVGHGDLARILGTG